MKSFKFILFLFLISCYSVIASDFNSLPYQKLADGDKLITTEIGNWTKKLPKNEADYYVISGTELISIDSKESYDTGCCYLFINKGSLIGYSNEDIKFYEFVINEKNIQKCELLSEDVRELFPKFNVINISDFSGYTNVYKFKKHHNNSKIMILNNTDIILNNYVFSSNNAKFNNYPINNTIEITKRGMIQFSEYSDESKRSPWFVILVR